MAGTLSPCAHCFTINHTTLMMIKGYLDDTYDEFENTTRDTDQYSQ
jgi:hypothetical protein